MESALSDLKKICDEVKDTLDPVILSSIECLIDKTYNALKDENEDARTLLEETLMRGVELVQKSKIGQNTLKNLTNAAPEEAEIDAAAENEGGNDDKCAPAEEERFDSMDTIDIDEIYPNENDKKLGSSSTDHDKCEAKSSANTENQSSIEHSISYKSSPSYSSSSVIRVKVDCFDN